MRWLPASPRPIPARPFFIAFSRAGTALTRIMGWESLGYLRGLSLYINIGPELYYSLRWPSFLLRSRGPEVGWRGSLCHVFFY